MDLKNKFLSYLMLKRVCVTQYSIYFSIIPHAKRAPPPPSGNGLSD